jgi:hypothetical protein
MTQDNNHYRYCFSCDKWKTKSEINEIDLGGGNKTYNCDTCRKDLGENIQIFRCKEHNEEILKVWGTLEGQNQEKIFFEQCPQTLHQGFWEKIPLPAKIGGGIITFLLGLLVTAKLWFNKASKHVDKAEDKLKDMQKKMTKDEEINKEPEIEENIQE